MCFNFVKLKKKGKEKSANQKLSFSKVLSVDICFALLLLYTFLLLLLPKKKLKVYSKKKVC